MFKRNWRICATKSPRRSRTPVVLERNRGGGAQLAVQGGWQQLALPAPVDAPRGVGRQGRSGRGQCKDNGNGKGKNSSAICNFKELIWKGERVRAMFHERNNNDIC